jgi:hypothetical protein
MYVCFLDNEFIRSSLGSTAYQSVILFAVKKQIDALKKKITEFLSKMDVWSDSDFALFGLLSSTFPSDRLDFKGHGASLCLRKCRRLSRAYSRHYTANRQATRRN